MPRPIEKYINSIDRDIKWQLNSNMDYVQTSRFKYRGDGNGDFEESSYETTPQCLNEYISYCSEQIMMAQEALSLMVHLE